MSYITSRKTGAFVVMFTAWFALILQFYLLTDSVANFFSYFTVLSNLLVAICSTAIFFSSSNSTKTFTSASFQAAVALYIFIVGLVYNIILRGIWEPKGWQLVADNALHVVVPIVYIIYWLIFHPNEKLSWKNGAYWMIFPFLYLVYSMIRGSFTGWYPYPFLNAEVLGYAKVSLNIICMIAAFFVVALVVIWVNNRRPKTNDR